MPVPPDPEIEVVAPNFNRRLSGVTATIERLVPLQAADIGIAAAGVGLPGHVPRIGWWRLVRLGWTRPANGRWRVWHARRNVEMTFGLFLKHVLRQRWKLLFTSASQRHHTWWSRFQIARMDAVIATSRATAAYLKVPNTVILHGIDLARFSPPDDVDELRRRLAVPGRRVIGCFGRIRRQKGTDVFVDAMIELARDRPDVGAVVLGRATETHGAFLASLKRKVADAGLADRIVFPGEVPVHQIASWYQALSLFVAPQRWEGFGLTPLEAMACGVPVVATTVGAFPELVVEGETGALVAPGDVDAMAGAVAGLLDDPPELERQGKRALNHVREHFPIEREAQAIIAIYRQLLASG